MVPLHVSLCLLILIHFAKGQHPPLEQVVADLAAQVELLKSQVTALQNSRGEHSHVAFFAQFSAQHIFTSTSTPFRFDQVVLNDGDAYNNATGIFTAPTLGVYIFTAQFFTDKGQAERPSLDVMVNGVTRVRFAFEAEHNVLARGEDSDSTGFTTRLQAGDQVWVWPSAPYNNTWWGTYHTFFSGALLYAA